jgi:succinate-semialdehyde dehydrogenase/glutarate-semialdehyde dehydrogenase
MEERQTMYPNVSLFIDGAWTPAAAGRTLPIVSPARGDASALWRTPNGLTSTVHWKLPDKGFRIWRKVSPSIVRR